MAQDLEKRTLFNLINPKTDTDKIYLYAKYLYEPKCQLLMNKRKCTGLKHFKDHKVFIKCSNDMEDIYKSFEEYNADRKRTILGVMYHIIPDKLSNKNLSPTVTDSYIRDRILNTSLFLLQNLILLYQKRLNY